MTRGQLTIDMRMGLPYAKVTHGADESGRR